MSSLRTSHVVAIVGALTATVTAGSASAQSSSAPGGAVASTTPSDVEVYVVSRTDAPREFRVVGADGSASACDAPCRLHVPPGVVQFESIGAARRVERLTLRRPSRVEIVGRNNVLLGIGVALAVPHALIGAMGAVLYAAGEASVTQAAAAGTPLRDSSHRQVGIGMMVPGFAVMGLGVALAIAGGLRAGVRVAPLVIERDYAHRAPLRWLGAAFTPANGGGFVETGLVF